MRRWLPFSLVGLLGVGVQALVLALLTNVAGWFYLPATALAVEIAVLHNFVWHERWTWAARTNRTPEGMLGRLIRFNLSNGLISLVGNMTFMTLYVALLRLPVIPASLLAIATTSAANFLIADRWVFQIASARFSPDRSRDTARPARPAIRA